MAALGTVASLEVHADFEAEARKRLAARDPDDWPVLATALARALILVHTNSATVANYSTVAIVTRFLLLPEA